MSPEEEKRIAKKSVTWWELLIYGILLIVAFAAAPELHASPWLVAPFLLAIFLVCFMRYYFANRK